MPQLNDRSSFITGLISEQILALHWKHWYIVNSIDCTLAIAYHQDIDLQKSLSKYHSKADCNPLTRRRIELDEALQAPLKKSAYDTVKLPNVFHFSRVPGQSRITLSRNMYSAPSLPWMVSFLGRCLEVITCSCGANAAIVTTGSPAIYVPGTASSKP